MIDIAQRAIERNSMIEIQIRETDEFIKLGQALKKAGLVESGVDAICHPGWSGKSQW